jgi:ATP-dependent RNA helicase DeaD
VPSHDAHHTASHTTTPTTPNTHEPFPATNHSPGSHGGAHPGVQGVASADSTGRDEPSTGTHHGHEVLDGSTGMQSANTSEHRSELFDTSKTFADMGLRASVLKGLDACGFKHPTKIQALLIPHLMQGKDMLGQARTGTGKTGAFGLPILHAANKDEPFQALILVPTRELCVQVAQEMQEMGEFTPIKTVAVYGGERMQKQIDAIKRGAHVVVSTPGRLMDMVERGHIKLGRVKFAVLDEVDRMLDIGFREDIRKILAMCPVERQTIFVSATISSEIERLAHKYARNAEKVIATDSGPLTTRTVKQFYLPVQRWDKKRLLAHLLTHEEPDTTLVFCKMKRTVDELEKYLQAKGIDAHAIHGDKAQTKRNAIISRLKAGSLSVLLASDLVARGIDVDGISHVINYDLPEDPENYVHRIGRTARIGREGIAWSLVSPDDGELLTTIENLINAEIPKLDYPDFIPSPPPEGRGFGRGPGGSAGGPGGPGEAPAAPVINRVVATVNPEIPVAKPGNEVDASKFPGGIVPTKLPPNRMFGRMKR